MDENFSDDRKPHLSTSKSTTSIDSLHSQSTPLENTYSNYSNDDLLKEFLDLYCEEIFTHSRHNNIILPTDSYLRTLDAQAEYLDYFHLRSVAFSEKVLPVLRKEQVKLKKLFLQIDAMSAFVQSYKNQIAHLQDVVHDIDAHTKKYSKLVPAFLKAKPKLNATIFGLKLDSMFSSVEDLVTSYQEKLRSLPVEDEELLSQEKELQKGLHQSNEDIGAGPSNNTIKKPIMSTTFISDQTTTVVDIQNSTWMGGDPSSQDASKLNREDVYDSLTEASKIASQGATASESQPLHHAIQSPTSEQISSPKENEVSNPPRNQNTTPTLQNVIVEASDEDDEDEGEVIFAEGESDEED